MTSGSDGLKKNMPDPLPPHFGIRFFILAYISKKTSFLRVAVEMAHKCEGMLDWLQEFDAIKPALGYKDLKEVKDIVKNVQKDFNQLKNGVAS